MIELESIDSTNNFLKSYRPLQPCDMILVTAEYQSRGRGQIGNSWESERGKNLLFSLKVHPRFLEAGQMFRISQVAALAVHDAFAHYTEGISIKWPNDVYWNDRKICGMLIENDWMGKQLEQSIIGIGMNVNQETFIDSRSGNGASIRTGTVYGKFPEILPHVATGRSRYGRCPIPQGSVPQGRLASV